LPPREQRGRLGRILVIGMYAAALSYLVVVGFTSVIPQVFWPERDESFDVGCAEGLKLLHGELDDIRLGFLTSNAVEPKKLQAQLEPWDRRLNALRERCDEEKVKLLYKYRYRVELNLERYMREDAPLANRVADTLRSETELTGPSTEGGP